MSIDPDDYLLGLSMTGNEEAALRAENDERERRIYGPLLEDVRFLRRTGAGVWKVGDKFCVDHVLKTRREFMEIVARERRLRGAK